MKRVVIAGLAYRSAGARQQIAHELEESPSLQDYPAQDLDFRYQLAVDQVYQETKLPNGTLSQNCPWTIH